jgi:branched-chain amino acid transport system ATP-binding protein
MLAVKDLQARYGNINALHGVSLAVNKGEIVALIGSNGAGKTTLLNTISGLHRAASGSIEYEGSPITRKTPGEIVRLGIVHCPEGRKVFPRITIYENLLAGAFTRKDSHEVKQEVERLMDRFPKLRERRNQLAGTLSGGEQQMLAICRSLMGRPRILLLDEPSMGLAPTLVNEVFQIIQEIRSSQTTILLVEQNAFMSLKIADRAYVLETGEIVRTGEAEALLNDDFVRRSYLGE